MGAIRGRLHGVHKWIAYDRVTGEVVGRSGLSRTPVDDAWGQIYAFLPTEPWTRDVYKTHARSSRTPTRLRSAVPRWSPRSTSSAYKP